MSKKDYAYEAFVKRDVKDRFILFLHLIFPGMMSALCVHEYLNMVRTFPMDDATAHERLIELEWAHFLTVSKPYGYGDMKNAIRAFSDSKAQWNILKSLAASASRNGWWPNRRFAATSEWKEWVQNHLPSTSRAPLDPMQVWYTVEAVRALLTNDKDVDLEIPPDAAFPSESVYWTACEWITSLLHNDSTSISFETEPSAFEKLAPTLFETWFIHRLDPETLLNCVIRIVSASQGKGMVRTAILAAAFSVWTNSRKSAETIYRALDSNSRAKSFCRFCVSLFNGQFENGVESFSAAAEVFKSTTSAEASLPFWLLGMALAIREENSDDVFSQNTVAAHCETLLNGSRKYAGWQSVGRNGFKAALDVREELTEVVKCAGSANYVPQDYVSTYEIHSTLDDLIKGKYYALAAVYIAKLVRTKNMSSFFNNFVKVLDAQKTIKLAKDVGSEAKWKKALRELNACLPQVREEPKNEPKPEIKLKGTIFWELELECVNRETGECVCHCAKLRYRRPRASGDGADDKNITLKSLATDKYHDILTEGDSKIIHHLEVNKKLKGVSAIETVDREILDALCDHPHLLQKASENETDGYIAPGPAAIERCDCEIKTSELENGDMALSVSDEVCISSRSTRIFRVGVGRYRFYPITHDAAGVIRIIQKRGEKRKLVIPKAARAAANDILKRMAGVVNVGGSLAAGDKNAFTRVEGDSTPHVRLTYTNNRLLLELVIAPTKDDCVPICAPGDGLAERLVQLRGGKTILLVRNLAAEKASAENVCAALAPFEAWQTGKNQWQIADADASLDALRALKTLDGVQLDWPGGEKLRVTAPSVNGVSIRASGTDWFEIKGDVKFDDGRVMKLMELLRNLPNRKGNYVRFSDDDYFYLSNELLRRMEALATVMTTGGKRGEGNRIVPAALPMLSQAFKEDDANLPQLPEILRSRAEAIGKIREMPVETPPRRFIGSLRYYQETGYKWLEQLAAAGFGACLADDMGLGKTVQIIALLLNHSSNGPSLVVAPASVCVNWVREIERFAPSLRAVTLWGEKTLPKELGAGDVIVSSYGLLVSRDEEFTAVEWNGIVLDEAQAVKNASTQRAQIVCKLNAKFRVAATGTPVENHLLEFWSIFAFLNPGLLGTQKEFSDRFMENGFATKSLKRIVEPFVLRRLKRDVLTDLPEKIEVVKHVALCDEEISAYEALRRNAVEDLQNSGETDNRISILAALTRLRRFCCHPSLVMPEMTSSTKLDAVMDLLEELRESGHRALVFSQFVDYLKIVRDTIAARGWMTCYLDGSTTPADRAAAVDAFQRGAGDFFLISLKAGGTGLNLTAANDVLLLDPWWNPAVEDQAADRAHRIGQKLPVTVYRIVAEGTVEDRILDLHADKRAISDDMMSAAKGTALTPDRLMSLFNA